MAAALTVSSTSAQQLIFIPTTTHQMMTPSFSSLNNNNEPPCRTRRLEPWRQQVREYCRVDATANCRSSNNIEKEEERRATTTSQSSFEDEINSFFDSIFSPPPSSSQHQMNNNVEDPFDSLVRSMLGFSLNAFDQIMAEATQQQPSTVQQLIRGEGQDEVNEEGVDNYPNEEDVDVGEENYPDIDGEDWDQFEEEQEGFEEVGVGKVSTQEDEEASEDAAVTTMDALVANLAHRSIHRAVAESEEEGIGAQEDTTSLNLPQILFEIGNNILAETTHSRRRLMEVGEGEEKIDPHLQVRERLGRRLTEYRQDLFLHPSDGTVTVYTRGLMSPPPVMTIRAYHPQEKIVASLGMGLGDDVDECMESRFDNGDLAGDCNDAVQMFFLAVNDRTLIPPSPPVAMERRAFMRDMHRAAVVHRQQLFTSEADEMNHLKCMLFWAPTLLLLLLLVTGKVCGSDDDDEDEEDAQDVSFDYSKMPQDGIEYVSPPCEGFSMKNVQPSEPKVYIGVPVQVV